MVAKGKDCYRMSAVVASRNVYTVVIIIVYYISSDEDCDLIGVKR